MDQSNCNQNFCETGNNSRVRMILIDPQGRFAGHSLPQGPGSYGETEVESPAPGTWTGVIFGNVASAGGTNGVVPWEVSTQRHVRFGSVSPSSVTLSPGQSRTVNVTATDPSSPGDTSGSVVITPTDGSGATSIPVTLRSLVEPNQGGRFSGNLTGGNGRPLGEGQEAYYAFDVGQGVTDIRADVSFAKDPSDPVAEYLVNPDGDTVGYGQNSVEGNHSTALSAYTINPVAGRWTLIVDFAGAEPGDVISQPYQGQIQFNSAKVQGIGVPDGRQAGGRQGGHGPGADHQHGGRAGGLLRRPAAEHRRRTSRSLRWARARCRCRCRSPTPRRAEVAGADARPRRSAWRRRRASRRCSTSP